MIKQLYPEAFHDNNKFDTEKVLSWYDSHKDMILSVESESKDSLEKAKLANVVILQNFEIEERKRLVAPIKTVTNFIEKIGISLGLVIKNKLTKELPPRAKGLTGEQAQQLGNELYMELITTINKKFGNWHKE